jgi:excisionase family DNA binding protein
MTKEELKALADTIVDKLNLCQKEVMSIEDVALYTGMKKSYIYKLTSGGHIPYYKPGGKYLFFKRAEIDQWLLSNRYGSADELNAEAKLYTASNPLPKHHVRRESKPN